VAITLPENNVTDDLTTQTKTIAPKLVDHFLETYQNPEDLLGEHGIFKQLTTALLERTLNAEMTTHRRALHVWV
jgi:putative transposase